MKNNVLKFLIKGKKNKGGRNNYGRITIRHRGGGHKRLYRKVNFNYLSSFYQVLSVEYDPNRNAFISIVRCLISDKLDYILLNKGISPGDVIDNRTRVVVGGRYSLKDLPSNYIVNSIEFKPRKGGQISRSSGSFCKILQKDFKRSLVKIKMPSLEERYVSMLCKATTGSVVNNYFHIKKLYKAGNSRWLGKKPSVRGVAMNPIDHPHGGGEGKTSGGRCSVTPWGRITIGRVTRSKRKYTNGAIFKSRRQF